VVARVGGDAVRADAVAKVAPTASGAAARGR